jgi:chromosome segregation ATPase
MKPKFFLFNQATEITPTGGVPAATAETPKPTLVERIASRFEEKTALTGEIASLRADLGKVTIERDELAQALETATAELTDLRKEKADIETALQAAESKITTVNAAAAEIAAGAGFPSANLPASQEAPADVIGALEKQLAESQCPKERQQLALKIKAAMKENAG